MNNPIVTAVILSFWVWIIVFMWNPTIYGEMFRKFDEARFTMQCE